LRGRPWLYYGYGPNEHHPFPIRHDLFGTANYTGAAGVLIVAALLATSNNYSLRAFGSPRWKRLQRWNYAVFALTGIHAVAYLIIEKQKLSFVMLIAASLTIVIFFQAMGYAIRHARRATRY
jgi:sulfoxide reductase heme-binding subunit YedZ